MLGSCSRAFLFKILHLTAQLFETLPNERPFGFRSRNSSLGLLLKRVDYVNRVADGDRVDGAIGSTLIVSYDLDDTAARAV